MAMGLTSKILVFMVVVNSLVMFAGGAGLLGNEVNVNTAADHMNQLMDQGKTATENMGDMGVGGIIVQTVFNPIMYIGKGIGLIASFFTAPVIAFGALPAPFSYMFGGIFIVLEMTAIMSILRGVAL